MPKYTVRTPIKHDGKKYAVGACIVLSKAEADALPSGCVDLTRADAPATRKASEQADTATAGAQQADAETAGADQADDGNGDTQG